VDLSAFSHEAVLVWSFNLSARAFEVSNPSLSAISHSGDTLMSEALSKKEISGGVVHDLPADLKRALTSDAKALETWEDITPLARNEWICWIESAKRAETRTRRIEWGCSSFKDGKRRPCCWPGCPHR
jgi:Bacteriocin-protection, YdeI or OmpD-Associated